MSAAQPRYRPVVLCILDGWGYRHDKAADNAIALARTPNYDRYVETKPMSLLQASELMVGLPSGQMGNSEVGHMNIGAGRVVMQDLPRLDEAMSEGSLGTRPALVKMIETLKASGGTAHIMGLMSPGGVHSHQDHIAHMVRVIAEAGVPVAIHAYLDGRDTPPKSALGYLEKFLLDIKDLKNARVGVVSGRYFAMDRDKRWDRVSLAYAALVEGKGESAPDGLAAISTAYERGETDEFVKPTVVAGYTGMKDGDGLLMGNFRADRAREILASLLDPAFKGFERPRVVKFASAVGLTEYSTQLNAFLDTMFPPLELSNTLGEVVARAGRKQLRIAETEKYAHVTFFLNGGQETEFDGESRILVPSPKVATYDLKPEMSAYEVADKLVAAIESGTFDLVVVNFANGDMVGHTGIIDAAIKAAEAVDTCLAKVVDAVERQGGAMLVTADHGNAEMMRDPETGEPHTAHTLNPVPFILLGDGKRGLKDGRLADIAPTVLELMGLAQPKDMTGHSLLTPAAAVETASTQKVPA